MAPLDAIELRPMTAADYDEVFALWEHIHGFALRSIDDARPAIERFLARNPQTSVVAILDDTVVGAILCGHDGRQGSFYHVCVREDCRGRGIGRAMVRFCLAALNAEGVSKARLVAFDANTQGRAFWESIGWTPREDFKTYEFQLNADNVTKFVT